MRRVNADKIVEQTAIRPVYTYLASPYEIWERKIKSERQRGSSRWPLLSPRDAPHLSNINKEIKVSATPLRVSMFILFVYKT